MEELESIDKVELSTFILLVKIYDYFLECLASNNQYNLGDKVFTVFMKVFSKDKKISEVNFEHSIYEVYIEKIVNHLQSRGFYARYLDETKDTMVIMVSYKTMKRLFEYFEKKGKIKGYR